MRRSATTSSPATRSPTTRGGPQFDIDHPWWLEAGEELPVHKSNPAAGGDYPCRMTSGHNRSSIHSMNVANPVILQTHRGEPVVEVNARPVRCRSGRRARPLELPSRPRHRWPGGVRGRCFDARAHPLPHRPQHHRRHRRGPTRRHGAVRPGRAGRGASRVPRAARVVVAASCVRRRPERSCLGSEVDVYRELILVGDGGRAYLESMSSLERTSQKRELYEGVVDSSRVPYPVQLVWGAYDRVFRCAHTGSILWPRRGSRRRRCCLPGTTCRRTSHPSLPNSSPATRRERGRGNEPGVTSACAIAGLVFVRRHGDCG